MWILFSLKTRISFREGKEVPGNRGYKYFGAARDLPGVRELFETEAVGNAKKTRAELMKVSDKSRDEFQYFVAKSGNYKSDEVSDKKSRGKDVPSSQY
jgi:hypothetical protein